MPRLTAFLLSLLLCGPAAASGYGWYAATLDWEALQRARPLLEAGLERERKADPLSTRDFREIGVLNEVLAFDGNPRPGQIALKDVSPPELEFYWPDALEYAYAQQEKAGIGGSKFGLFRQGRSYWRPDSPAIRCGGAWYCSDAYFFLSPPEVAQFAAEVKALNARVKHPQDYRDYLIHLQGMLRDAARAQQALYFYGSD